MMLLSNRLRVVLATIHTSIAGVPGKLSSKKITALLKLIDSSLKKDFRIKTPSIAVCGLNPHVGENGAFGDEESRIIMPGIKNAAKAGVKAEGPFPADTIFHRVVNNKSHDAVLAMYHDQGLIPLKLLCFDTGVNVTLGLPIIRTSPDHGTAYDIAGTGAAADVSLFEALRTALLMAKNRDK
jgi:4-hydroxythreonine-4-phosphate dehydrogenase